MTNETNSKIRVGIVGSDKYENKIKIKDLIYKLKKEFGSNLIIISGGRSAGADVYVKKYALDFGCEYKEFNPAYTQSNLYSALREDYYGKPYSLVYARHRNLLMIKNIDCLFIFINDTDKKNYDIEHVIKTAEKIKVKYILIN